MNTKQTLAIVLAERLDAETEKTVSIDLIHFEAAAELRRLHAENEALRTALQDISAYYPNSWVSDTARAALAQPGGVK